jgi:hypothetical protein
VSYTKRVSFQHDEKKHPNLVPLHERHQVLAFATVECPQATCTGEVTHWGVLVGWFSLLNKEDRRRGEYVTYSDPLARAYKGSVEAKWCPECGTMLHLTKKAAQEAAGLSVEWAAANTPEALKPQPQAS